MERLGAVGRQVVNLTARRTLGSKQNSLDTLQKAAGLAVLDKKYVTEI